MGSFTVSLTAAAAWASSAIVKACGTVVSAVTYAAGQVPSWVWDGAGIVIALVHAKTGQEVKVEIPDIREELEGIRKKLESNPKFTKATLALKLFEESLGEILTLESVLDVATPVQGGVVPSDGPNVPMDVAPAEVSAK